MMTRRSARARKYRRPLTELGIARILSSTLPKRNGYRPPNTRALLKEVNDFGITTELQFRLLILKHRRELIADDRACLSSRTLLASWTDDYGAAHIGDMKRRQYCFSWEALVRNALELEFREAYEAYARKRDGL